MCSELGCDGLSQGMRDVLTRGHLRILQFCKESRSLCSSLCINTYICNVVYASPLSGPSLRLWTMVKGRPESCERTFTALREEAAEGRVPAPAFTGVITVLKVLLGFKRNPNKAQVSGLVRYNSNSSDDVINGYLAGAGGPKGNQGNSPLSVFRISWNSCLFCRCLSAVCNEPS